jgi:hypothetical protein
MHLKRRCGELFLMNFNERLRKVGLDVYFNRESNELERLLSSINRLLIPEEERHKLTQALQSYRSITDEARAELSRKCMDMSEYIVAPKITIITKPKLYELGELMQQAVDEVFPRREPVKLNELITMLGNGVPDVERVEAVLKGAKYSRDSLIEALRNVSSCEDHARNTLAGDLIKIASGIAREAVKYED